MREQKRAFILTRLIGGQLTAYQAAELLKVSPRQVRRLKASFSREGPAALVHGNRGRAPANSLPEAVREQVLGLARGKYHGFNHQHFVEKLLEEEQLAVSRMSVHRILRAAGLTSPRTRRPAKHRRRRERMAQEGMLLQADGSRHQWLGADGPWLTLIGGIDDATGTVPWAVFREQEDAQGYMEWLREVVSRQGVPLALYVDRHGIFLKSSRDPKTVEEQLLGHRLPTQFGRVLEELAIRPIYALSPQAKGRVERLWGTFQDRLVSELRLAGVSTLADAQRLLPSFLAAFNDRFAVPPAQAGSAYRPLATNFLPEQVFCFKYDRTVAADNTVGFAPHRLQIAPSPQRPSYARAHVEVHERLDGSLAVYYQGQCLATRAAPPDPPTIRARSRTRPAPERPGPPPLTAAPASQPPPPTPADRLAWKPAANHPWKRSLVARK
jgi:transposase